MSTLIFSRQKQRNIERTPFDIFNLMFQSQFTSQPSRNQISKRKDAEQGMFGYVFQFLKIVLGQMIRKEVLS